VTVTEFEICIYVLNFIKMGCAYAILI